MKYKLRRLMVLVVAVIMTFSLSFSFYVEDASADNDAASAQTTEENQNSEETSSETQETSENEKGESSESVNQGTKNEGTSQETEEDQSTQQEKTVKEEKSEKTDSANSTEDKMTTTAEAKKAKTSSTFAGGDGTETNPYQVATAEQLDAVRNDLTAHYVQTANIDLAGREWTPIGGQRVNEEESRIFSGSYDGGNHAIRNMTITKKGNLYVGLFGLYTGRISNINLSGCEIDINLSYADDKDVCVGSIAGKNCEQSKGSESVDNCSVEGQISLKNAYRLYVGGVVGIGRCSDAINYTDIQVGAIQTDKKLGRVHCGGIMGYPGTINSAVSKCVNYGDITASADTFLFCGGISGQHGVIDYCVNYGTISGQIVAARLSSSGNGNCNIGGIVGYTSSDINRDCVNYGEVFSSKTCKNGTCYAGGYAGYIGFDGDGTISNCYNLGGKISASVDSDTVRTGRIAGRLITENASKCYSYDKTLVNGAIPTEKIGTDQINGGSMSWSEINEAIKPILESLGLKEISEGGTSAAVFPDGYNFENDSYAFKNYRDVIPQGYFTTLFEDDASGKAVHELFKKKWYKALGGVCFGMAYTTASIYNDLPTCSNISIGPTQLFLPCKNVREIKKSSYINFDKYQMNMQSFIKYSQIYQYSSEVAESTEKTEGKSIDLYNTVKDYIDRGKIGVSIGMFHCKLDSEGDWIMDSGHQVLAVGYDGRDILVDDSNHRDELQRLTINADGSWSYSGSWKTDGVNSNNSWLRYQLDYYRPYQILSTGTKAKVSSEFEKGESEALDDIYVEGMKGLDGSDTLLYLDCENHGALSDNAIEIMGVADMDTENSTKEEYPGDVYWLTDSDTVSLNDLKGKNNTVFFAGDNTIIKVNAGNMSTLDGVINETEQSTSFQMNKGDVCTVSFETVVNDETDIVVRISGIATDGKVSVKAVKGGLEVNGMSNGTVELLHNDKSVNASSFDEEDGNFVIEYDNTAKDNELSITNTKNSDDQPADPSDSNKDNTDDSNGGQSDSSDDDKKSDQNKTNDSQNDHSKDSEESQTTGSKGTNNSSNSPNSKKNSSDSDSKNQSASSAETGDTQNPVVWIVLMTFTVVCFVVILLTKRWKYRKSRNK